MRWIILALFLVPLIEIALFVTVGAQIGLLATLAIAILTAAIGSWLFRSHGRGLQARFAKETQTTGFPAQSIFEGLCLGAAAIFLMTPGFFTDVVGFSLFVPPVRGWLFQFLSKRMAGAQFQTWQSGGGFGMRGGSGPIIDGESETTSSTTTNDSGRNVTIEHPNSQ